MRQTNLDMDVLRTLATAMRLGSFGKAAEAVGRSQSAVSLQMKRLEEQVGQQLFARSGRKVVLTETGALLLSYGERILALNDEAVAATRGREQQETIRLGVPADLSEGLLPALLTIFSQEHPGVHIEARVDRNVHLIDQVRRGEIDIALAFGEHQTEVGRDIGRVPIHWIGNMQARVDDEVTLVLFDAPCVFRDAGLAALDRARRPWRVALTSPSLSGLWAATGAGLGITVRTPIGLPANLRVLDGVGGLPQISETVRLSLHSNENVSSRPLTYLRELALSSLHDTLRQVA